MLVPLGANGQLPAPPPGVEPVGGGVSAPRIKTQTFPEFSEQARKARYQGTCVLSLIVGVDGLPRDIKVIKSLGMGLDEKAVEAVRSWRFDPALKKGEPVAAMIAIEVEFHLYGSGNSRVDQLQQKADSGDAQAELDLANIYFEGREVPKDDRRGLEFLEKAARHNLPRAQFLLAEHVAEGPSPDYPTAYMWYTLAHRGGYKKSGKALKQLSARMTTDQIQEGQALADRWTSAPSR